MTKRSQPVDVNAPVPKLLTDELVEMIYLAWDAISGASHADLIRMVERQVLIANGLISEPVAAAPVKPRHRGVN